MEPLSGVTDQVPVPVAAGVLHGPAGQAHAGRAAVEELDEVVSERCARVAAAAVHLTDDDVGHHRRRRIVVRDGPRSLAVGDGRAADVAESHRELLGRFEYQVAVDGDRERVGGTAWRNQLRDLRTRHVVAVAHRRRRGPGAVGGRDVERDARMRAGHGDGKRRVDRAAVALGHAHVVDGDRRTRLRR